jgi:hypothetical protein
VRPFPIIRDYKERAAGLPTNVPWEIVAPHEAQAQRNHDQSLEVLASRGGLSPCELFAVMHDQPWKKMDGPFVEGWLASLVTPKGEVTP